MKKPSHILFILVATLTTQAFATEPSYCDPKVFYSKEIKTKTRGLKRAHFYQLGEVKVLGVGVGTSNTNDLVEFAKKYSTAESSDKYCTWYYNQGNFDASNRFTHIYLKNPDDLTTVTGPKEYGGKLKDQFSHAVTSYLSCAINHKYIAMGCNSQKHRGPTVFGMMLAFSGCSPAKSAEIVNTVWGLNGIEAEVRQSIIAEGKRLGDLDPEARMRLQKAFGN